MDKLIFAGIVLYNPDIERLSNNLADIVNQVNKIILVDNASNNSCEIDSLLKEYSNCVLIKNDFNMGIAKALNQIMIFAKSNKCTWALTLDQDSVCEQNLIKTYQTYLNAPNIGMITCLFKDRNFDNVIDQSDQVFEHVNFCITSGCLLNVNVWNIIGGFDEQMFIDRVDNDICLSIIEHNYKILRVNKIGLLHEVGRGRNIQILGKTYAIYNHSPFRRYYICRNSIYLVRKHKSVKLLYTALNTLFHILLVFLYEDEKRKKLCSGLKGFIDGFFIPVRHSNL